MKKATLFSLLSIFVLIPATLFLGTKLTGRQYYITVTLVIIEVMLPFFFSFEARKPQPRELVTIAVMAALAAVSRAAFAFLPSFKPITGIIMITGIAFGAEVGFLTGALGIFASNFFFSQGPWTPWQMLAYGIAGFVAGAIFHKRKENCRPIPLAIFGFFHVLILVGPLLDCCTIFTSLTKITWPAVLAVMAQGLPMNAIHAGATALTLFFFAKPLLAKLFRLQTKYGMITEKEQP